MTSPTTTLPPDLVDGDGDLNLVVGYGTDGEPRYHLTSMSEDDEPEQEWVERRRLAYRAEVIAEAALDDMRDRDRLYSAYGIRRERPRTVRYDWDPQPGAEAEEAAQVPEPAPAPAEVLEPDLETDSHIWVYTGHDADGVRRYRAMDKRHDGTLRHPDFDALGDRYASVSDVEQVRRWCSDPARSYWPTSCDVEGYILLNGVGNYSCEEGAEDGEVRERPRTVRLDVVDDRTPADRRRVLAGEQSAPEPEPAPEQAPEPASAGGDPAPLDDAGLPVDPGPDHPEEERLRAIRARTETVQARHEQFRRDTRTEVLASQSRHGWCAPGTDRVLCDLGLDKINAVRRVTATVSFEVSGTNSDENATTFARNKITRAIREALGDRLRGSLSVAPGDVFVTRHED